MMSIRNRVIAAVGGVGLTLAIAVAAVAAGGPLSGLAASSNGGPSAAPTATTAPASGHTSFMAPGGFAFGDFGNLAFPVGLGEADVSAFAGFGMGDPANCQEVQSKFAANLGVTTDQLQAAIKKTMIQEIDEAEKAGKLTADRAKAARDRVNSTTDFCAGFGMHIGGVGGPHQGPGQGRVGGINMADSATYQAVATYFGITSDQLKQDLADKGSLQGVAAKYGKDTAAGKAGLQAAIETAMKADLAKQGLSQEMIDRIVAQFKANFDNYYTAKLGQGINFGPGGPGKQRPGGPRTSPAPSATPRTQ